MIESMATLLWHAETPTLVSLAVIATKMKKVIRSKHGIAWTSKQRIPACKLSVEATLSAALGLGERLESLQDVAHTIVHRGEAPITDAIMDDLLNALRKELCDMEAFLKMSKISTVSVGGSGSEVTAAASVAAVDLAAAAAGKTSSSLRKRSYARARNDEIAMGTPKVIDGARVATFPSAQYRPSSTGNLFIYTDHGHSFDQAFSAAVAASSKGLVKCQIDKLVLWMEANGYSSSFHWEAIDELVESTGMKTSQVVVWIETVGGIAANYRKAVQVKCQSEVITIDDDGEDDEEDNVPDLADEDDGCDAWTGLVAEEETAPATEKPIDLSRLLSRNESELNISKAEAEVEFDIEAEMGFNIDSASSFDLGFEFGDDDSKSCDGVQVQKEEEEEEEKKKKKREESTVKSCWSNDYIDELLKGSFLLLDGAEAEAEIEIETDMYSDDLDLEPLDLGLGFDFEASEFFKGVQVQVQGGESSAMMCEWSGAYEDELLQDRFLHLSDDDFASDDKVNVQCPSKDVLSDSLDNSFALLD